MVEMVYERIVPVVRSRLSMGILRETGVLFSSASLACSNIW